MSKRCEQTRQTKTTCKIYKGITDPVFCLVGKGAEESIFMGVSLGSFKSYQLTK